jgi:ATP-binding cassette subfamily B (MDR/TAP) protein 1
LGENVTLKIRKILYGAILQKEIGFHDFRENGSSVLTSAMAQESSLINGVSTESIGPQVEAFFAVFVGLAIGFGFCWQESLICLALTPFMIIG